MDFNHSHSGTKGSCSQLALQVWAIARLAAVVLVTFAICWLPWLGSWTDVLQVLRRLTPIDRGLFEDYVANFWCVSHLVIKWERLFSQQVATAVSPSPGDVSGDLKGPGRYVLTDDCFKAWQVLRSLDFGSRLACDLFVCALGRSLIKISFTGAKFCIILSYCGPHAAGTREDGRACNLHSMPAKHVAAAEES